MRFCVTKKKQGKKRKKERKKKKKNAKKRKGTYKFFLHYTHLSFTLLMTIYKIKIDFKVINRQFLIRGLQEAEVWVFDNVEFFASFYFMPKTFHVRACVASMPMGNNSLLARFYTSFKKLKFTSLIIIIFIFSSSYLWAFFPSLLINKQWRQDWAESIRFV